MSAWDETETHREPDSRRSGWHPVNVGHLVMGVAFAGLALVWLLVASEAVDLADARWLLPAPWIAAGVAGLAATALRRPVPATRDGD